MATREEFLALLWARAINPAMREYWIDNNIQASDRYPDSPFADLGPALTRLLDAGASRRDLSLIFRFAAYEAVFETLCMLDDPGVAGDSSYLHEELLMSDPSGLEGRPGSAPGAA